ncbi:MAG: KH domain-containing protein [Jaaginema sp. PMC 1079.18]|nr:KH domain-containing protein [Jaaginema sp. PMC 1080.18]MEC4852696.1 KH domain-containing protein [Jaaginema sp. PMC 1079.18]MEC4865974.1 KH domain-containing protein [Jaaginema sp. PMC 1078.18]
MTQANFPDYTQLVRFLMEPLLDSPELLKIDCEVVNQGKRVWVRVAFAQTDRGRLFGRGGRNIQAIRTVLQTATPRAGSVYLDIYSPPETQEKERQGNNRDRPRSRSSSPRKPQRRSQSS